MLESPSHPAIAPPGGSVRLRAASAAGWARERLTTTPGKLGLLTVLVVISALCFGSIASLAERSRSKAAERVRTQAEPLLVNSVLLYTALSDAHATATTTFLKGGLEPPALRARYLADLRLASDSLATLTHEADKSVDVAAAVKSITEELPLYSGLIEAARADSRQGFPIGAAYLRAASARLTGTILPQANRLYATEAGQLSDDYGRGTGKSALIVLIVVLVLALILLVGAQVFLARLSRRIINLPMAAATVVLVALSVWSVVGLINEENALSSARSDSDSVELLSASRVLLSRAQSDQSLTLANRGSDQTDPADRRAVLRVLARRDGLVAAAAGTTAPAAAHRLRAELGSYRAETARVAALERSQISGATSSGGAGRATVRLGARSVPAGHRGAGPVRDRRGRRDVVAVRPFDRHPGAHRGRRGAGRHRAAPATGGVPVRRWLPGLLLIAALLCGCGASADPAERTALSALNVAAPKPAPSAPSPAAPPCGDVTASLRPPATMPPPGSMPSGSFMAKIQRRGYLIAGVDQNTLLFAYFNPLSGRLEGFEIDLLRRVAQAIFGDPSRIKFKAITTAQRVPAVQDGTVDVVADAMTITCQRRREVDFSTVYYDAGQRILVPSNSRAHRVADLGHRRVCATKGSTSLDTLEHLTPRPVPYTVAQRTDCLVAMQEGLVDAITSDDSILLGFRAQDPEHQAGRSAVRRRAVWNGDQPPPPRVRSLRQRSPRRDARGRQLARLLPKVARAVQPRDPAAAGGPL